jgi:hypothetical protein
MDWPIFALCVGGNLPGLCALLYILARERGE